MRLSRCQVPSGFSGERVDQLVARQDRNKDSRATFVMDGTVPTAMKKARPRVELCPITTRILWEVDGGWFKRCSFHTALRDTNPRLW